MVLSERTRRDIDVQVSKILRGLGNPTPPLVLGDVRALLRLDLGYYSSQHHGPLAETISKLRIGIHQVLRRPTLLVDAVRKLSLKALWLPDRKKILIDAEEPPLKHRWNEAHEIGHSIIDWHKAFLHGDQERTLSPDCHYRIEAEANYAAGRLLFLQDRFTNELKAARIDFKALKSLKRTFGNTLTATLWRAVEHSDVPALGIVGVHPHYPPADFNRTQACRHFIRSPLFAIQFSHITELDLFEQIQSYCRYTKRGPLGEAEVVIADNAGEEHVFVFETFNNSYDTLTLGIHRRQRPAIISASDSAQYKR